ncbi:hypothetical protein [Marinifilum sp. D737]|nr:hypothetical protein [Marinifilum sp. D737]MCY1634168.1 hypothetical protein [Marinifilum sp. D737]
MFEPLNNIELKEALGGIKTASTFGEDNIGFYEEWWEDGVRYRRYLSRTT